MKSSENQISELKVDGTTFTGDNVADGFFTNIKNLKTKDLQLDDCHSCHSMTRDYNIIREICKAGLKIPSISIQQADELLRSLRPSVYDHWNISPSHFLNAGPAGILHFQFLMNSAINEIENTECDELNMAHACILYKGHSKDKTLASSYRTISTCPFLAKALDTYIRSLSVDDWQDGRSEVQFLGPGMGHDLAALLLTESVYHSINIDNKPVFALFLDARSAFDKTIREIMV